MASDWNPCERAVEWFLDLRRFANGCFGSSGFRNILVHGYLKVDPQRVEAYLAAAPDRFSEFSRDIRQWLEALGAR